MAKAVHCLALATKDPSSTARYRVLTVWDRQRVNRETRDPEEMHTKADRRRVAEREREREREREKEREIEREQERERECERARKSTVFNSLSVQHVREIRRA